MKVAPHSTGLSALSVHLDVRGPAAPTTDVSPSPTGQPSTDFAWFPLANPGIVSIPLAFVLGIVGSLTGVGAEKAVGH